MKRRLEIARALLGRPRILLLDEPTLGLDPIVRSELWEMIRTLQAEQGVTVLVSTHYLEEAQSVCDRVAIIDQGKIIALDTPSRLIADLGQHVLDLGVGADPGPVLAILRQAPPGLGEPMRIGSAVSVPSSLPAPELTDLASRLDLTTAGATTISLTRRSRAWRAGSRKKGRSPIRLRRATATSSPGSSFSSTCAPPIAATRASTRRRRSPMRRRWRVSPVWMTPRRRRAMTISRAACSN